MKRVTLIPLLCLLFLLRPCMAAEEKNSDKEGAAMITPAAQRAIDKALGWLAGRQNDDGSFGSGAYRANVGICGLSGMALMAGGSTPGRGPYGQQVDRALDYVLANAQPSGFICEPAATSHGPMYGHGFATTFLAECYGMSPRADLREKLSKAVKLIINCQNKEGGWRYYPQRDDADISVTVCQVMALRAAHNAGLYVPDRDHRPRHQGLRDALPERRRRLHVHARAPAATAPFRARRRPWSP